MPRKQKNVRVEKKKQKQSKKQFDQDEFVLQKIINDANALLRNFTAPKINNFIGNNAIVELRSSLPQYDEFVRYDVKTDKDVAK